MQSREAIRAIKERLNIVDIVRRYVELKRNGPRWIAPCPFHQETKPSFSVNEEQGLFYCFGCQASGDLLDFYGRINGLDFRETLEQLAAEAGITLEHGPSDGRRQQQARQERSARQQMLRMNEMAASHFAATLRGPQGEECRAYVARRGLSPDIVERFGLGWAPREWQSLAGVLHRAGFADALAVEAGLLGQSDRGRAYDRFRGRLMFPIRNLSNQIIAFGGRIIGDEDEAKYINSAETPLYHKGDNLYGLAQARKGITTCGRALLTEGYMDVLTLHQFGYDNAVGVLGTALTPEQIKRLSGFTSQVVLLFDGDRAGRKAALRSCEMLLARGLACQVVLMPDGEDIDSLLRTRGTEAFEDLLRRAPDGLRFCVDVLRALAPRETVEWARTFLSRVEVPELLSQYASRLATHLQLAEDLLRQGMTERRGRPGPAAGRPADAGLARQNMRDVQIMLFAVRYPHRLEDLRDIGADLALQSPEARAFWDVIEQWGAEEAPYHMTERQRQFWFAQREGPAAAPLDSGDHEFQYLKKNLDAYYASAQKSSVSAALQHNTGTGDFSADLEYLRALQDSLEKSRHDQT
ncbi:DNA primase [uncultured Desulfovibrio sp.]|uniref:DNA primase n=1 Tax=uncultured Desulfovibrio sp. TaxID=167968 RepID=UPI002634E2A4|nr:DNA primase [uncultured Desulfovibrio sp.]